MAVMSQLLFAAKGVRHTSRMLTRSLATTLAPPSEQPWFSSSPEEHQQYVIELYKSYEEAKRQRVEMERQLKEAKKERMEAEEQRKEAEEQRKDMEKRRMEVESALKGIADHELKISNFDQRIM